MKADLAKRLFLLSHVCPRCKRAFREDRVETVAGRKYTWQFRAICGICSGCWPFEVHFDKDWVKIFLGDLKLGEWGNPRFSSVVSGDEVLDIIRASAKEIEAELISLGILEPSQLRLAED